MTEQRVFVAEDAVHAGGLLNALPYFHFSPKAIPLPCPNDLFS